MLTAPHQRNQMRQPRSSAHRRPPQALPVPADPLAPARGVVLGALLGAAMWAGGIGLALRFLG